MNEFTVYPGEYIPPPEVNALLQASNLSQSSVAEPLVNIDEFEQYYKIEVVIFGVTRDAILITADDNMLSVTGIIKYSDDKNRRQLHEFDHCCFNRHIPLPKNTDPECIIAEYRSGILSIYVPKSAEPLKNIHTRIAVY